MRYGHGSMFGGYTRMHFSNTALEFSTKFKLNENLMKYFMSYLYL